MEATYRPILRFKRGEQTALSKLSSNKKATTKPLLSLTPHSFNPLDGEVDGVFDQHIEQDANQLNSVWGGYSAAVDLSDIASDALCMGNIHPVRYFFDKIAAYEGQHAIINPVLRFSSDDDYVEAVASVCDEFNIAPVFRLTPDNLADRELETVINGMLERCGVQCREAEMVVDMGHISTTGSSIILARGALAVVPFAADWSALSLVAGSFPASLSDFAVGMHTLERHEWAVWLSNRSINGREVFYGDYATLHSSPIENELDPRYVNPSASVRYTHEDTWILFRGHGVKNRGGPGFSQFYDHAENLVRLPNYRGVNFSFGDEKIMRISQRNDKTGNLETWVKIGVNHHISEIVGQLSNLAES